MQPHKSVCTLLARKHKVISQYLQIKKDQNPVYVWGCGAFATRVYHYCQHYEVPVAGFFVNVPEEKTEFEGLPVLKIEQVVERYPRFSVIIDHANYIDGVTWLKTIKSVENVYCITSCCYDIWNSISEQFLKKNEEALNNFYFELQDETSRKCFLSYFESRMNDDPSYMFPYYKKEIGYYKNDIFTLGDNEILFDIGACIGNSIWPFLEAVNGNYQVIIALEPDKNNCSILSKNIEDRQVKNVVVKQACAYDKNCCVKFSGEQEQGGIQENAEKYYLCSAVKLDSLCHELNISASLLKINFPFSVPQVLKGATELLQRKKPKIIIRAGFDENVLIETYETIKSLNPEYQIYLRYTVGIPQGLTIFAI